MIPSLIKLGRSTTRRLEELCSELSARLKALEEQVQGIVRAGGVKGLRGDPGPGRSALREVIAANEDARRQPQ